MHNINNDYFIYKSEFFNGFFYDILTPKEIYNYLNYYVTGQESAKKILSVAIHNHFKRLKLNKSFNFNLIKSNILLIGPSGTGKTFIIQILSKLINVPFIIVDANSLTEAGYVGEDVESILQKLFQESFYDLNKTEMGIVYIDEIDKINKKNNDFSGNRDISGEGVQQALLKFIEGTICNISLNNGKKSNNQLFYPINTSNILFICGGAFCGLDKIISDRIEKTSLGFGNSYNNKTLNYNKLMNFLEFDDLVKFGIIPELIGRLPIIVKLNELDIITLKSILVDSNDSILKHYNILLSFNGIKLTINDEAAIIISNIAYKKKTGARGLRNIIDTILSDIIFEIENLNTLKEIVINKYVFDKNCKTPLLIHIDNYF